MNRPYNRPNDTANPVSGLHFLQYQIDRQGTYPWVAALQRAPLPDAVLIPTVQFS